MHLSDAILFANDAFYTAFAAGDYKAMADIWAIDRDVTCLHPGWEPLLGREQVLASWQAILRQPPALRCVAPRAILTGEDSAYVLCYEQLGDAVLIATNVFVRQQKIWRIVHHQSGPTRATPPQEEEEHRGRAN